MEDRWINNFEKFQYEYKQQNAKKKKVTIEISVDGVRICLKKRKRRMRVVSCCSVHESSLMIKLFLFTHRENHRTGQRTQEKLKLCIIQFTVSFMCLTTVAISKFLATLHAMAVLIALSAWYSKVIKRWAHSYCD